MEVFAWRMAQVVHLDNLMRRDPRRSAVRVVQGVRLAGIRSPQSAISVAAPLIGLLFSLECISKTFLETDHAAPGEQTTRQTPSAGTLAAGHGQPWCWKSRLLPTADIREAQAHIERLEPRYLGY
jgi:hypothetical protein